MLCIHGLLLHTWFMMCSRMALILGQWPRRASTPAMRMSVMIVQMGRPCMHEFVLNTLPLVRHSLLVACRHCLEDESVEAELGSAIFRRLWSRQPKDVEL